MHHIWYGAPCTINSIGEPFGVRAGRVNGKLRIQSYDAETWRFPALRGRLRVAGAGFHFFDAPDDFSDTRLDLLFEGDRLYLHGAQGLYGAVPVTVNGARLLSPSCMFQESPQLPFSGACPGAMLSRQGSRQLMVL